MIARRTRSFSDAPLGGSIANRAVTDEALWERLSALRPMRAETVQIGGPRLPDRGSLRADVFGRRRGDATRTLADAECMSMGQLSVDSCPPAPASKDALLATYDLPPPRITDGGGAGGSDGGNNSNNNIDEDSTAMAIERALGESFGKLRGSKNMTMAFKKVARSAEGMVRRADIAAVDFGNDPKEMLILDKGAKRRPRVEPPTFSTTMTARQAAATLETICREMACKVKRVFSEEVDGAVGTVIKLRVVRPGSRFGPSNQRRLKAVITICEEDKVRTDVYLKKVVGLLPDTAAFLSLSEDIRSRFQREWPRLVDALYMRSPS